MNKFADYIPKFQIDINSIIRKTLENKGVQQQVIDLVQYQLSEGLDANEKSIQTIDGSPYTEYTKEQKRKKGQPYNRVTLKDTGDYYDSMHTILKEQGLLIDAQFEKGGSNIMDNFPPGKYDFLNLTDESKGNWKQWVLLDIFADNFKKVFLK